MSKWPPSVRLGSDNRVRREWPSVPQEGGAAKRLMGIWARDRRSGDLGRLSRVVRGYNLNVLARTLLKEGIHVLSHQTIQRLSQAEDNFCVMSFATVIGRRAIGHIG